MPPPSQDTGDAPSLAVAGMAVEVEDPPLAAPTARRPGAATQSVGRGGIHHQPSRTVLGQIPRPTLLGRWPTRIAPRTEVVSACRRRRQQFTESTPTTTVYRTLSAAYCGGQGVPRSALVAQKCRAPRADPVLADVRGALDNDHTLGRRAPRLPTVAPYPRCWH